MENIAIRMLLCDVDGTLLPKGHSVISNDVFHTIRKTADKRIAFVVASGRSYKGLHSLFAPVADIVSFICCDGALAVQNNQIVYHAEIQKKVIAELMRTVSLCKDESLVLYGKEETFCMGCNHFAHNYKPIDSVDEITCAIYKIAFYNLSSFSKHAVKSYASRSGQLSAIYSDSLWTEFVANGINKGIATAALQTRWNISPLETAAFGDNMNDIEMLRRARLSFAPPEAVLDIVKMCKFSTKNVTDEILKILEKGESHE